MSSLLDPSTRPPRAPCRALSVGAVQAEWLRATFALSSRPSCYGVVRAESEPPIAGFCGTWRSKPRLTLIGGDA